MARPLEGKKLLKHCVHKSVYGEGQAQEKNYGAHSRTHFLDTPVLSAFSMLCNQLWFTSCYFLSCDLSETPRKCQNYSYFLEPGFFGQKWRNCTILWGLWWKYRWLVNLFCDHFSHVSSKLFFCIGNFLAILEQVDKWSRNVGMLCKTRCMQDTWKVRNLSEDMSSYKRLFINF